MALNVGMTKIEFSLNKMTLTGFIIFDTVLPLYQSGVDYLNSYASSELEIDLSQVKKSDSSGLSVLLGWMRVAKQKKINIHFTHVPSYLLGVAKVCGVEAILPIKQG